MRRLLPIPLAIILLVTACGTADEAASQADSTVTVPPADAGGTSAGSSETPDEALSMAFVSTPADGELMAEIEAGAPEPTAIEVLKGGPGEGSAAIGTDGVATVAYALWTWDGEEVERSYDIADRLSLLIGDPSDAPPDAVEPFDALTAVLDGLPVGVRVTALFPAGTQGLPLSASQSESHVLVLDVLAFQTPENS